MKSEMKKQNSVRDLELQKSIAGKKQAVLLYSTLA